MIISNGEKNWYILKHEMYHEELYLFRGLVRPAPKRVMEHSALC